MCIKSSQLLKIFAFSWFNTPVVVIFSGFSDNLKNVRYNIFGEVCQWSDQLNHYKECFFGFIVRENVLRDS